jgi:hypothetical protein
MLGVLLVVYIVLVGPINYLALRQLRKPEWGWLTIPALTLLFSVGTFSLGFSMRGGDVIVNKISILSFTRNTALPMETFIGIFSPERRAFTIQLPGRALVTPISMDGSNPWGMGGTYQPSGNTLAIVQGDPSQVHGVMVNQWAMQSLRAESPAPEGWRIDSDLVFDGSRMRGTLTNRTDSVLVDVAIVSGNRFARLGDLPPGQSAAVDQMLQNPSGSPFPYFLYQDIWQNPGPQGPPRELQARQQTLEGYFGSFKGSPQPPTHPILVGWSQASPFDVQVDGSRWTTQQASLVIAELDLRYAPGPIHLAPGSLPAQIVESQGDAGICGPVASQLYINNGTVKFEFELPDELRTMRITKLAVQFQQGGSIPKLEVLDYTTNTWVRLDSLQSGRNELADPARFVSPAGKVRLQAKNTDMSGGCSMYELDIEGTMQ